MSTIRLFWSQETIDEWIEEDKVIIKDDVLNIEGETNRYSIKQAVHFLADVGDGTDQQNLVGRVKELDVILELGAEHYMDSVLLEDTAYKVVTGFIGTPLVQIVDNAKGDDISEVLKTQAGESEIEDRELLAKFLLDNL